MLTFLLILILVFAVVDLFVQLVIEPLALKKKKEHVEKISTIEIEPIISAVGATMYDGGKSKKSEGKNKSERKSLIKKKSDSNI